MRKILLIDDDDYKILNVKEYLLSYLKNCEITTEKAVNPALKRLLKESFDIILLDMSIPEFSVNESENFNSFGGLVILNEMHRKKNNTPVVIVTQYEIFGEGPLSKTSEAIDYECKEAFDNYKGMIIYSSTKDRWKEELFSLLEK